jgi:branched-chain amino acid transport system permease protein
MMCFYGFLGTAWNIIGGYVGLVSLGHAAYYGVGAYVSTLIFLGFGITPWLGLFLGAITAAALSFAIGIPSIRFKGGGAFFCMISIAFAETARLIFLNLKIGGGAMGVWMPVLPESFLNFQFHESKLPYYYIILSFLLIEVFVVYKISKSRMGYSFVAIREDEVKAEAVGINIAKYKLIAFAISAFFTAIAGVFYAQYVLYFDPYTVFPLELSVYMVLVATIGGRGTVLGPVLGAFILTPLSEYSRAFLGGLFSGLSLAIYGVLLMLVVITVPEGIIVWARKIYNSIVS